MFWGRQTGWKTRAGSAGSDNEAHWSCKRRVTAKVVQNDPIWLENQENQGCNFLDSGIPKFSRRRPMPAFSLVGFKQETAFHTPINQIFGPARGQIYQKNKGKLELQNLAWMCQTEWLSICVTDAGSESLLLFNHFFMCAQAYSTESEILWFFDIFWPLARPKIAKKRPWSSRPLARPPRGRLR